ncbi:N-acetylneuraminate lyase isoform X2 [Thalassophryne amazonica]|uniref:N-acetylneuraminate lyase isoform X2 n=1 Tax=Thalassophryne amazonica TaxID=390379 RepID=UPI001471AE97|nr:N-acetylneuraminate lyase isoform X2 [Thalassophryne amazonica]
MAPTSSKQLVAATFTPLTGRGEINLGEIEPYLDYLTEKQGVYNIFVNGTTGEGMSLSVEERKLLAKHWCEKAKEKNVHVIVHVGCMSLKDSQELAEHAACIKADGVAVIAPSFLKPKTADALRKFLQEVALFAQGLPFYYYHIPAVTGITWQAKEVLEGIETLIPSFSGVKFSSSDLMDFGLCLSNYQKQLFLYGVDEQLLPALAMGADGAVGSTYNYLGCQANQLLSAFENSDLVQARKIQNKMQELISYAMEKGPVTVCSDGRSSQVIPPETSCSTGIFFSTK